MRSIIFFPIVTEANIPLSSLNFASNAVGPSEAKVSKLWINRMRRKNPHLTSVIPFRTSSIKQQMDAELNRMNREIEELRAQVQSCYQTIWFFLPNPHESLNLKEVLALFDKHNDSESDRAFRRNFDNDRLSLAKLEKEQSKLKEEIDAIEALESFCMIKSQNLE